jgi:hypothetical protein
MESCEQGNELWSSINAGRFFLCYAIVSGFVHLVKEQIGSEKNSPNSMLPSASCIASLCNRSNGNKPFDMVHRNSIEIFKFVFKKLLIMNTYFYVISV